MVGVNLLAMYEQLWILGAPSLAVLREYHVLVEELEEVTGCHRPASRILRRVVGSVGIEVDVIEVNRNYVGSGRICAM